MSVSDGALESDPLAKGSLTSVQTPVWFDVETGPKSSFLIETRPKLRPLLSIDPLVVILNLSSSSAEPVGLLKDESVDQKTRD
jgi:hypothetical protein